MTFDFEYMIRVYRAIDTGDGGVGGMARGHGTPLFCK